MEILARPEAPLVFLDVETTGLSAEHERMTEIALVGSDGEKVLWEESTLLNPGIPIPSSISALTGIRNDMVAAAPRFHEKAKWILERIQGRIVVGHNVRFDQSFLSAEFGRLGFPLRLSTACTVRLAKYHLPEKAASYSLGPLTAQLGIRLVGAHRALADARASAELFHLLFKTFRNPNGTREEELKAFLDFESSSLRLPPNMSRSSVAKIPAKTGVYYFYSTEDTLIYVGKALNIRERALSHFSADMRDAKERKIKEQVARIESVETGSELVALLFESAEIKKHTPVYNRAQRRERAPIGLYAYGLPEDAPAIPALVVPAEASANQLTPNKYVELRIHSLLDADYESPSPPRLIKSFQTMKGAHAYMDEIISAHRLCPHYCSSSELPPSGVRRPFAKSCFQRQIDRCDGACLGLETAEAYNLRFRAGLARELEGSEIPADGFVVEAGRKKGEWAIILIEGGVYRGYGFYEGALRVQSPAILRAMRDCIQPMNDNSDVRRILRNYLSSRGERERLLRVFPLPRNFSEQLVQCIVQRSQTRGARKAVLAATAASLEIKPAPPTSNEDRAKADTPQQQSFDWGVV